MMCPLSSFRKNWACVWTVLEGGSLIFFKDSKHSSSSGIKYPSVPSSPEFNVNLHGASLSWAHKDRSSRKNVLELKTQDCSEYLIQHDLDSIASMWHNLLKITLMGKLIFSLFAASPTPCERFSKTMPHSLFDYSNASCLVAAFWHYPSSDSDSHRIRNMLRKFLLRRPSLQYLRDRGYIKDQVFGCALQDLCDREKSKVPHFVRQCIATVEKRGLDIDGLYRISGNLATIQNLRFRVDHNEYLDLDGGQWDDVHVITGALKLFFRELPEPLFPFSYFNRLIAAAKVIDPAKRRHHLREVVYSLPPANFNTSRVLFQHLSRVVEFREKNRMSLQSIAIIFGPTLLRPQDEEGNIAMYMFFQNQVMEQILSQTSYIFPES
uniref:Rho GTPase activating protein 27 n=1 Tax=Laticauda laticaudata TaxID=8630 RepID=A0A8C5SHH6_LATLA